ncbi:MAG TPA: DUF1549 and DUF1553 domain-containing protein, partial [Lacipirellulaceae bacterium]|nr:DUF1549 and DUF1553 domain-containing protein [Lacipirellulaceae bacterium]
MLTADLRVAEKSTVPFFFEDSEKLGKSPRVPSDERAVRSRENETNRRRARVIVVAVAATLLATVPQQQPLHAADAIVRVAASSSATSRPHAVPPTQPAHLMRRVNDYGLPQVASINESIQKGWSDHSLVPSHSATDGEWCRRVYLDVIGRIPTVPELNAYLSDKKRDKREALVDQLLGERYNDEYTRNWTTIWTNILVGRTGGTDRKSLVNREGMERYLTESLKYDKPYDEMAKELITAVGSCRPGDKDFNGAANFLADKMADNGVQATAQTSQIFLGMEVQCTQCHNHPFNEYKQNQFWEMNAFFRQTKVEKLDDSDVKKKRKVGRIVNVDFRGEGGDPNKAEIYYELRNGKLKVAYPVFVDGTSLASLYASKGEDFGDHGMLKDINRREELSKLILASREFDRAIVNRMWAHFLGYGFTKPIDDIGPHNPPSNPELLDKLGNSFRESGFDMKKLMRWIVLSEPYSLSSQISARNQDDDPSLGAKPMFSRFYMRQMEAEQLYESLLVATAADNAVPKDRSEMMKDRWLQQFSQAFGTDDNGESTTFNGSIPQALTLMNGELIRRATDLPRENPRAAARAGRRGRQVREAGLGQRHGDELGSMLQRIADDPKMDNAQKIRYLYLAGLSRLPTKRELTISNELLAARGGRVGPALQDIWWAVLNTNEFILIH